MDCMEQRKAKTRKERENGAEMGAPWEFSWQTGRSKEFFLGGGESVEIFLLTFSLKSFMFSGVGNGNLLQYSCLENSMEHGGLYNSWGHKESDVTKKL